MISRIIRWFQFNRAAKYEHEAKQKLVRTDDNLRLLDEKILEQEKQIESASSPTAAAELKESHAFLLKQRNLLTDARGQLGLIMEKSEKQMGRLKQSPQQENAR